jgi:hypothetical protein
MGQDAYLYVVCDGDKVRDPALLTRCTYTIGWYVERWPYVFRLLTGRSRDYEDMPDPPKPIAPSRGLPPGWTQADFEDLTGDPLDLLDADERACLTWYTLAELQGARDRHAYLNQLVVRIESATTNPEKTLVIVWVDA